MGNTTAKFAIGEPVFFKSETHYGDFNLPAWHSLEVVNIDIPTSSTGHGGPWYDLCIDGEIIQSVHEELLMNHAGYVRMVNAQNKRKWMFFLDLVQHITIPTDELTYVETTSQAICHMMFSETMMSERVTDGNMSLMIARKAYLEMSQIYRENNFATHVEIVRYSSK